MEQSQVTDEEIRNVRNTVVGKDYVEIWSKMLYYLCTELLYLREAKRMALRAAPEHDTPAGAEAVAIVYVNPNPVGPGHNRFVSWLTNPADIPPDTKLYTQPAHGEREPDDEAMVPRQPNPDLFCGNVAVSNDPRYAGWVFVRHIDGVNWTTCAKMSDATWQMLKSYWGGK